jgi:hypothetical protein
MTIRRNVIPLEPCWSGFTLTHVWCGATPRVLQRRGVTIGLQIAAKPAVNICENRFPKDFHFHAATQQSRRP